MADGYSLGSNRGGGKSVYDYPTLWEPR